MCMRPSTGPRAERSTYLDLQCAGDPGMHQEVEKRLAADWERTLRNRLNHLGRIAANFF